MLCNGLSSVHICLYLEWEVLMVSKLQLPYVEVASISTYDGRNYI